MAGMSIIAAHTFFPNNPYIPLTFRETSKKRGCRSDCGATQNIHITFKCKAIR